MAHIIVVGNEKGGAGKSTVSMHVATAIARMGFSIAGLDLDLRQRTFGRYVENRERFMEKAEIELPSPKYFDLPEIDPGQSIRMKSLSGSSVAIAADNRMS